MATATQAGPTSPVTHAGSGRKPLPFPLPDPYTDPTFEMYDPHGFNLKRRPSTRSTTSSTATSTDTGDSTSTAKQTVDDNKNNHHAKGPCHIDIDLVNDISRNGLERDSAGTDNTMLIQTSPALSPSYMATSPIPISNSPSMRVSSIPSLSHDEPIPEGVAVPPASGLPPSQSTPPRQSHKQQQHPSIGSGFPTAAAPRGFAALNKLRIGSGGGSSSVTRLDSPLFSPDYFTPSPSTGYNHTGDNITSDTSISATHSRQATNDSTTSTLSSPVMSGMSDATRSRASSMSTSTGMSPAASFLSSFSRDNSINVSGSGRFSALLDGDDEGFVVAGYTLGRELGKGGFGIVREATKNGPGPGTGDKVAVKIVKHKQAPLAADSVADPLKRSVSGYRIQRDRRASLVQDRHRSTSSPVPAQLRVNRGQSSSTGESEDSSALSTSIGAVPSDLPSPLAPPEEPLTLVEALLQRELDLWRQLPPHPHLVQLIGTHKTEEFTYVFMPLCEGGNLLEFVNAGGNVRRRSHSRGSSSGGGSIGILGMAAMSTVDEHGPSPTEQTFTKGLPLDMARIIFAQIVEGLHYLHVEVGVTHKDIKLDNILCDEWKAGVNGTWKIADFGLAESATSDSTLKTATAVAKESLKSQTIGIGSNTNGSGALSTTTKKRIQAGLPLASLSRANSLSRPDSARSSDNPLPVMDLIDEHLHPAGSLPYSPPEQMKSPIPLLDPSVDIWALGCVLYAMIEGCLPFQDEFEPRLRLKIIKGQWTVPTRLRPEEEGGPLREEESRCLECLKGCLEPDVSKRWTVTDVRNCRWLKWRAQTEQPRGRASRRGNMSPFPGADSRSRSAARRESSSSTSTSRHRRKPRSSSRSSSHVKHRGIDDRTRNIEIRDEVRDERRMRWDRSRESARSTSASSRTSSSRGRSVDRSGASSGAGTPGSSNDPFDLRDIVYLKTRRVQQDLTGAVEPDRPTLKSDIASASAPCSPVTSSMNAIQQIATFDKPKSRRGPTPKPKPSRTQSVDSNNRVIRNLNDAHQEIRRLNTFVQLLQLQMVSKGLDPAYEIAKFQERLDAGWLVEQAVQNSNGVRMSADAPMPRTNGRHFQKAQTTIVEPGLLVDTSLPLSGTFPLPPVSFGHECPIGDIIVGSSAPARSIVTPVIGPFVASPQHQTPSDVRQTGFSRSHPIASAIKLTRGIDRRAFKGSSTASLNPGLVSLSTLPTQPLIHRFQQTPQVSRSQVQETPTTLPELPELPILAPIQDNDDDLPVDPSPEWRAKIAETQSTTESTDSMTGLTNTFDLPPSMTTSQKKQGGPVSRPVLPPLQIATAATKPPSQGKSKPHSTTNPDPNQSAFVGPHALPPSSSAASVSGSAFPSAKTSSEPVVTDQPLSSATPINHVILPPLVNVNVNGASVNNAVLNFSRLPRLPRLSIPVDQAVSSAAGVNLMKRSEVDTSSRTMTSSGSTSALSSAAPLSAWIRPSSVSQDETGSSSSLPFSESKTPVTTESPRTIHNRSSFKSREAVTNESDKQAPSTSKSATSRVHFAPLSLPPHSDMSNKTQVKPIVPKLSLTDVKPKGEEPKRQHDKVRCSPSRTVAILKTGSAHLKRRRCSAVAPTGNDRTLSHAFHDAQPLTTPLGTESVAGQAHTACSSTGASPSQTFSTPSSTAGTVTVTNKPTQHSERFEKAMKQTQETQ
ncbi:hypothetical protein OIO90_005185 [Microbotryomycetes sp. JL221]|nr:hypothetical protein OIO90_005185 [Microbotryomycetes sp. JL221]